MRDKKNNDFISSEANYTKVYKDLKKIDKHSGNLAYLQIVNQIKAKLMIEQLKKGMQLSPVRELEDIFDANVNTVLKALDKLKMEGILKSEQGIGYFVNDNMFVNEEVLKSVETLVSELKSLNVDLYTTPALIEEVWKNG